jgi:DNA polymerase-3 subunit delta
MPERTFRSPSGGRAVDHGSGETDTKNSLKDIFSDFKKGKVSSCYLLYGEETFLIADALARIVDLILPVTDRDLNLFYMDGDQVDIAGLCQSLLTPPLIPGKKVVILKNTRIFQSGSVSAELIRKIKDLKESDPDRAAKEFMHFLRLTGWSLEDLKNGGWKRIHDNDWQKTVGGDEGRDRETWLPELVEMCVILGMQERSAVEGEERLLDILKDGLPEKIHLILTAEIVDKRKKLFKIISEKGKVLHFPKISIENRKKQVLMDTAREILAKAGKNMTPGAWMAVGKKTGFVPGSSVEAIEQLITYAGEKILIEERDVEELIGKTREGTIFDLTNALSEKNLNIALIALKDLLDQGVHELLVLSMMAREVRLILYAVILIRSGKLDTFDSKTDYGRFQKSVYPVIRSWTNEAGKKEATGEFFRLHPYVMYHALKYSYGFSFDMLVGYLEDLVAMDISLKSTARDSRYALERFVMKVCS